MILTRLVRFSKLPIWLQVLAVFFWLPALFWWLVFNFAQFVDITADFWFGEPHDDRDEKREINLRPPESHA